MDGWEMSKEEFEQFVLEQGNDILRFCRISAGSKEGGKELYQDTMLKLLEKRKMLDAQQNLKAYALSVCILILKNKKKKYAVRNRIIQFTSLDKIQSADNETTERLSSPEDEVLDKEQAAIVRKLVAELPEKYRIPLYMNYSAGMKVSDIAEILKIPIGTAKSRIRTAKAQVKERLEALEYDR
jgi:RNA polymerase sigma-70 factor (ECF subfamily)